MFRPPTPSSRCNAEARCRKNSFPWGKTKKRRRRRRSEPALHDLQRKLGPEAHLSKQRRRERRHGGGAELARVLGTAEGQQSEVSLLVRGEERLVVLGQAEHAREHAAGGYGVDELERDATVARLAGGSAGRRLLLDLEVRDGVRLVAGEAVRDVHVVAVARDNDLAHGGGGGVGGGEGRAEGAQLLGAGEGDGGAVVGDGEDLDRVLELADDEVVRGLGGLGRVPGAVAGAAAGGDDAVVGGDVVGVVLGVDDKDGVGAEVVDGEEAARGVEDGLVRVRLVLANGVGAEGVVGFERLEELEGGSVGNVPDIDGTLAAGGRVLVG